LARFFSLKIFFSRKNQEFAMCSICGYTAKKNRKPPISDYFHLSLSHKRKGKNAPYNAFCAFSSVADFRRIYPWLLLPILGGFIPG
jgi:hypothetical protein